MQQMGFVGSDGRDRLGAAAATLLLEALLAYVLIVGLWTPPRAAHPTEPQLALFDVPPEPVPPPPPPAEPPRTATRKPEGAASPPNLHSKATEIVAPQPKVLLPPPPPVVTAPQPGPGNEPTSGAADIPGPGTGSGGAGVGTGSGRGGYGEGGGGFGRGSAPVRIRGRIKGSDYPLAPEERWGGGTVDVIFAVETDGRADDCRILHSSGNALIDGTVCRLIEQRYRFRPALDREGRPVRSRMVESHGWSVEEERRRERY